MADFYTYLSGTNGNNGKSAYELWKETVETGNMLKGKTYFSYRNY